jgi:hypothetical protein
LRSPDVIAYSLLDDRVMLCDMRTEEVYGLENVAADMWRALVAYGDLDAAVEYLLNLYEVEETRLRCDLDALTDELVARGLLEQIDGAGTTEA